MITVDEVVVRLEKSADYLINEVSKEFPIVNFAKPVISRVLKNSTNKITKYCELLANEEGIVDFSSMAEEMLNSAINSKAFTIDAGDLGEIEIGGGNIKVPVPFTKKVVSFGLTEINELKKILVKN
jgi:hypothetical protein